MKAWFFLVLLANVCLLFGCGIVGEKIHTKCPPASDRQAREAYICGEYWGAGVFYKDLEIFSNYILMLRGDFSSVG